MNYNKVDTLYEWVYENVDECGGIEEVFGDSAAEVFSNISSTDGDPQDWLWRIALVRYLGNDDDGVVDRDYAYVDNDKLPIKFKNQDFGVPQRFHKELAQLRNPYYVGSKHDLTNNCWKTKRPR